METESDEEIEFFERELNLSHALLDIAGPKPLADLIAKARLGYEYTVQCIGRVHDPAKLSRITAKLERLRERLSKCSSQVPSAAMAVRVKAAP